MENDGTSARVAPAPLDAALSFARSGLPVVPLHTPTGARGGCSCGKNCGSNIGKHPRWQRGTLEHGHQQATTDEHLIRRWWQIWPKANIGMPTGKKSGLWVIDVDPRNGGSLEGLAALGPIPETMMARTGSGGWHLFFRCPGFTVPNDNKGKVLGPGYDIKGDGGFIVAPPSLHKSGKLYTWANDLPPAEAPAWLIERLRAPLPEPAPRAQSSAPPGRDRKDRKDQQDAGQFWLEKALERTGRGKGDDYGYWLAQQLLLDPKVNNEEQILREYARAATLDPANPFDEDSVRRWVRSAGISKIVQGGQEARSQVARPLTDFPERKKQQNDRNNITDISHKVPAKPEPPEPPDDSALLKGEADDNGNAEAMWRLFGREYLYTPAYGWLRWTGTHWQIEPEPVVAQQAIITLKRRRHAAVDAGAEAIIKATKADKSRVLGCLTLFKSYVIEPDVAAFDADPDLLNCRNGVLNLRTGKLTPHDPCQRFTYCVPVDYDPHANMDPWVSFALDALGRDADALRYFQLCVGYSLTGHTREEKMFYLYGPPRAGKGTVTETLLRLLPHPLSTEADFATFTAKRDGDSQNFDLADLKPARLVIASESNRYQALNPAKIKSMTGGNLVRCAFKHKDMFTYRPQFKVWLVSNHPVNADADDDALWGRVQVFVFPHSHLGAEDVTLKARMKSLDNLKGVLRWAVEGAMAWYQQERLQPPETIVAATQAHRETQDFIKLWLEECTTPEADCWTPSGVLLKSYRRWCEENSIKPVRSNDLADALVKRFGYERKRQPGSGSRGFMGIHVCDS